jgi:type III pantothenate kinase
MDLAIDVGNTSIKAAFFDGEHLHQKLELKHDRALLDLIKGDKPQNTILSSVRKGTGRLVQNAQKFTDVLVLSHATPIPVRNEYSTPHTLGMDRIAAIVGARHLYKNENVLVIDAGTCITYDLIDSEGIYKGGAISPGMDMKFKALHKFTSKLPTIGFQNTAKLIGKSTKEAILSGVVLGTLAEIEGIIQRYQQYFDDLTILICGGKSKFFESKIKGHIFALPDLVLIGLNQILRFNVY